MAASTAHIEPIMLAEPLSPFSAKLARADGRVVEWVVEPGYVPYPDAVAEMEARALAIAINGLLDGLWLEGCLAGELFEESELVGIALTSIETLLGLSLRQAGTAR